MRTVKGMVETLLESILAADEWMEQANCLTDESVDPTFKGDADAMMKLCASCPVLEPCREKFEAVNERRPITNGVFGGIDYNR